MPVDDSHKGQDLRIAAVDLMIRGAFRSFKYLSGLRRLSWCFVVDDFSRVGMHLKPT